MDDMEEDVGKVKKKKIKTRIISRFGFKFSDLQSYHEKLGVLFFFF